MVTLVGRESRLSDPASGMATDAPKAVLDANIGIPALRKPSTTRQRDMFDSEDFDAVKFVNQIYPDESSLGDLDSFVDVLRRQIYMVDKEIFQAVRTQGGAHTRARQDLTVATSQITELFGKVKDIQRKAEDTEGMVQEICRDIKKLDYAKRHLTTTITSLRRLAMLTAAISDLEQVAYRRDQYKKCADLLEAVSQLMEYFQQYESVPKIKSLARRLQTVQSALQEAVLDDFKILMGQADVKLSPENLERLANACLVINALGSKVRDQIMDWLCDREMTIYQTIFSMSGDAAKIGAFDRRFQWFKSRLEDKKDQWALFPESWRVPQTLCLTFCKITKAHLKRILNDNEDAVKEDVGPLIKTVVATNKFEKEMAAMFGGVALEEEEDDLQEVDNLPASEARRRLEAFRKKQQAAAAARAAALAGEKEQARVESVKTAFEGSIAEAFEDSLKYYVQEEQRELLNYLDTLIKEENERKWFPSEDDPSSRVLASANKLFLKIRQSLTRCVRLVSKGKTLVALGEVFQRVLSAYASELLKRLPKTAGGLTSVAGPYQGTDWYIRMSDDEETVVCHILHTAEYCKDTVEGLTAALHKDMKADLVEKVDMSDEENAFVNVASQCLSVLCLGVNTRLDAALQEMQKFRWDLIEQPGDDSLYVNTIRKVLLDCAPRLGKELDQLHFSFFCDKMARMFIPRFLDTFYKLKKVSEKGTLQLSIDSDAIKRILLDFPKAARVLDEEPQCGNYMHYVEREMGTVINLVKVMQAKPENLVDTFVLLMPANNQSPVDFLKLCELKGFTKKLQTELLQQLSKRLGREDGPLGPLASGASAISPLVPMTSSPNISNFKLNVNQLAESISSIGRSQENSPVVKPNIFKGGHVDLGFKGFTQQTAAKTREGLGRLGTFTANILPGKLGGGAAGTESSGSKP